jgi:hypothetical protein
MNVLGRGSGRSAFGVVHKILGDDPKLAAPVKQAPTEFRPDAVRAKLRPLKLAALKAVVKA